MSELPFLPYTHTERYTCSYAKVRHLENAIPLYLAFLRKGAS